VRLQQEQQHQQNKTHTLSLLEMVVLHT